MALTTSDLRSQANNPNAVCIARSGPRFFPWAGRYYRDLAPTYPMLKMTAHDYDVAFDRILAVLNPARVLADLGPDAVLCCWELAAAPTAAGPIFYRCHRRRVAEWLEASIPGLEIPELGYTRAETPAYADMPSAPPKRRRTSPQLMLL